MSAKVIHLPERVLRAHREREIKREIAQLDADIEMLRRRKAEEARRRLSLVPMPKAKT